MKRLLKVIYGMVTLFLVLMNVFFKAKFLVLLMLHYKNKT